MAKKSRSTRHKSNGSSKGKRNIYLGKRVKDTRKPGLDNLGEVRGIANAIIKDYQNKKISYRTAMSRENMLSLVVTRDSDFTRTKLAKAKEIIKDARAKLMKRR